MNEGLFFIVGSGRSGTTLLQRMLSAHPRISIPPETHFFDRFDPALRFSDPLKDADISAYVKRCASEPWLGELGVDIAAFEDAVRRCRGAKELFTWLLRALAQVGEAGSVGAQRLGEKTPRHEKFVPRIASLFPEAKFIHIHRDPRDVVASLLEMPWWSDRSAQRTALYCRRVLERRAANEAALGPARHASVGYERLVAGPEETLRAVCGFLGEAFDPRMLRPEAAAAAGFTQSEAGWKEQTRRPVTEARVGRHRSALTPRQIDTIERVVGPLMEERGYALGAAPGERFVWRIADAAERVFVWPSRRLERSVRKRVGAAKGPA